MSKKLALIIISIFTLTSCGKNGEKTLKKYIDDCGGYVFTAKDSLLQYNDKGDFNVFAASNGTNNVDSGFLGTFKFGDSVGSGYFKIDINEKTLVEFSLIIYS